MAEKVSTHVMYKGRHYILPGDLTPDDAFVRVKNLTGGGPKLKAGTGPSPVGFEDTSAEVADILERRHEPNRARDVLPKLLEFTAQGALATTPAAMARGAAALRGLSGANKARQVATAAAKGAGYGAAGYAANEGLQAAGVPPGVSEAMVGMAGLGTKPGRAAIKAGLGALRGEVAAEAVAAEAAAATKVLPAGQRAMATNLGGKARPGPAPTPPDELEAVLKASLDKIKNAPPLKGPRIEVGAQKVGRQVGMTKEEVRKATGPVLDEAVGEASPILPKKALTSIIDTMKAIPVAEREAYVAKATSGKAKWQVENIRRTLEHLGLLLPVGAAAAMEGQE